MSEKSAIKVLEAHQLTKEVSSPEGSLTILKQVSFSIKAGESVAIVGPSGAGKSTLLALLAGLDLPTQGNVDLNGANLSELDEDGRALVRAESVGFVFQSFHLVQGANALQNVMLPLELSGIDNAPQLAIESLRQVGLEKKVNTLVEHLSGGEQQRVAIARAFAIKPQVLFADEPTGNLDAGTGRQIADLMFHLRDQSGTTLVLVTHESELLERGDRQILIESGRLLGS